MLPFLFILLHLLHSRLLLPTLSFVPLPMALPCAQLSFLSFIVISIGQRAGLGVPFHQYTSPSFGHSVFLYHEAVHIPSIFFSSPPHLQPQSIVHLRSHHLQHSTDHPHQTRTPRYLSHSATPLSRHLNHILYSLSHLSDHSVFCLLVRFYFELCKMWMLLSLRCTNAVPPLFAVAQLSRMVFCAECTFIPVSVSFLPFSRLYDFPRRCSCSFCPHLTPLLYPPDSRPKSEHVLEAVSIELFWLSFCHLSISVLPP